MSATTDPTAGGSVISLPSGGGSIGGLGETFSPDLFTGTGNFSVPIGIPPGRLGMAPRLALGYSTGNGNGPCGLGWQLSLPGVSRKTAKGVPRYVDLPGSGPLDVFVLSGAEDLVPVSGSYPGRVRYRPRTEGLFARIEHVRDASADFWEVRTKDGLRTRYGTPRPEGAPADWRDPAAVADPRRADHVAGWRITETRDPVGNVIRYDYLADRGDEPGHVWNQPLIARISYADYGDQASPAFLAQVEFDYEPRPDPFSNNRSGFDIRTTLRCRTIRVVTQAGDGVTRVACEYRLSYEQASFNGASLLTRVDVVGIDDQVEESSPPLTFGYSAFDPGRRRFRPVTGPDLPARGLTDKTVALVDLRGVGLPDVVELGDTHRYWSNAGNGRLELARSFSAAPPFSLDDKGVQFMDANGDGRPDLVVAGAASAGGPGYFPMAFASGWSRQSFQPYPQLPSVGLADPTVKLVDLDGDGLTDVLQSGSRLTAFFNDRDPHRAWRRTAVASAIPDVDLADPHVHMADLTGDGLADIVLVRSGAVAYWPNLGHGRWGVQVAMRRSPRLPDGHDPRRLLLGDIDGDGCADLIYVDNGRVLLWGNQSGTSWTAEPVVINGTPTVVDTDAIQLSDLLGTGMAGLLYSGATDGSGRPRVRFLDVTGGVKPYLLSLVDNNNGAATRIRYSSSTQEYLRDQADPAARWRTTLPFPTQVVVHVEVVDSISHGRMSTEYRYHHGYWDGEEREFRGFARVDQLDTETFYGPLPAHYSPPTLTKHWFHPGPVAADAVGDWTELDLRHEYWDGDAQMLERPAEMTAFLRGLSRSDRRSALRALRGQALRTELYALDGADRHGRPYTVTEGLPGVREEEPPRPDQPGRQRIFLPLALAQRATQWERGEEPMTRFTFSGGFDAYGFATQRLAIAVPRGRDPLVADADATSAYLATLTMTEFARRDDSVYLVDRTSRGSTYEVVNDGRSSVADLRDAVLSEPAGDHVSLQLIGHTRNFYDGAAFVGAPLGVLGEHGLLVRSESLAMTDPFVDELGRPAYLDPSGATPFPAEYPQDFRGQLPPLAGYVHYTDADVPGSPGGYYGISARHRYNARGMQVESLDASGASTRIEYDSHDLLPVTSTDAVGLTITAGYDYRVLKPREVTDTNGNHTSVVYSPLALVTAHFVRSKTGEGDRDRPSVLITYDRHAFVERGQPESVRTDRRVHHDTDTDVPADLRDAVLTTVEYNDGFGRLIQTRGLAEDTLFGDPTFGGNVIPAEDLSAVGDTTGRTRAPADPDNVLVSGLVVYDNKGRVVQKYEPYFDTGFDYSVPLDPQLGQHTTTTYDPRGQAVRTLHADGSQELVILGVPADLTDPDTFAPTPWISYAYDANDNAGRTHGSAAAGYHGHWNTPLSVEIDALGRAATTVTRNGPPDHPETWFTVRHRYDIHGNLVAITDALGREAFRYAYDLAKRCWRTESIDAGRRDTVPDVLGNPIESRDSKGALTLGAFDVLHRPTLLWARDDATGPVTLRERIQYGDGGSATQPPVERDAAREGNLLGRPVRHYDDAGLSVTDAIDFKGNVLRSGRRMVTDAQLLGSYKAGPSNGWEITPFQVDWTLAPGQTQDERDALLLEPTQYATTTAYDALNRVTGRTLPTDVEGRRRELRPTYNRAGLLDQIRLDDTVYVHRIAYDAKSQPALVAYGNGVMTRYAYDQHTFRPVRLRSEPFTLLDQTYHPAGKALQEYGYDYDLAGNLLTLRDRTPGGGIPNNPAALDVADPRLRALLISGDALDRRFGYDPVYRLLRATGREQSTPPTGDPWIDLPRGTDITKAQPYVETYQYDAVSSLLSLEHSSAGGFSRTFDVGAGSNRLQRMFVGKTPYDYTFDTGGNQIGETSTRHFAWGHSDQLKAFGTQTPGAEPSVHAQYLYDAAGRRVKKLVRKQGGAVEVTHYIDEIFEHHRWSGSPGGQNNHVHVVAGGRAALVRLGPAHPDDLGPVTAFHLADHLGSSTVVLDVKGTFVNREEYTPYGETSFGSYARKRYRFTGRERDEESGLSQHGRRYYQRWLGRWSSCDPIGPVADINQYGYAHGNPIRHTDGAGTDPADSTSPPALNGVGLTINANGVKFGPLSDPRAGPCDELSKKCGGLSSGDDKAQERTDVAEHMKTYVPLPNRNVLWRRAQDANPLKDGMTVSDVNSKITPGEHVLNNQGSTISKSGPSRYLSSAKTKAGTQKFYGKPYAIDVDKAKESGAKILEPEEISKDLDRMTAEGAKDASGAPKYPAERTQFWKDSQKPGANYEGEHLIEPKNGHLPPNAIETPLSRGLKGASQVLVAYAVYQTVKSLTAAAIESVRQGDIRPLAREAVVQATTWATSIHFAGEGAAFGLVVGSAFGPVGMAVGAVVGGLVGGIAGAVIGYLAGSWLSSLF